MGEAELDQLLEAYLKSHSPKKVKGQWVKPALAAICTVVGTAYGAGFAANAYLSRLATKEYIDSLRALDAAVRKDDQEHEKEQDRRLGHAEDMALVADKCCSHQAERIDKLTTPTRLGPY
jgi:hypothetical protein